MTLAAWTNSMVMEAADTMAAVAAVDLSKELDDRLILSGLAFEVARGRFTGLLGANGAGKSTLLKILATLMPPSGGTLRLLGSMVERDGRRVRSRLGLIGHAPMLYRDLTVMENLVIFGRLYGLRDPRARAVELLEYVDLADRADDPVKTFSRGMTQRAAIARALMHDPELILADEPFAGLDAVSRDALEKMLRRLHADGRTIILANHDIGQSLELTEQTLVLRKGRLVVDAASSALTPAGLLKEVSA